MEENKENKVKITLVKQKIWCPSSEIFFDYFVEFQEKQFCLHCVLIGNCDEELGLEKK